MNLTAKDIIELRKIAERNGTLSHWADIAEEFMLAAEKRIEELMKQQAS